MGTKVVPTYPPNFSNACAKNQEEKLCSTVKEKFGQNMEPFIENRGKAI
jgi:hypothetical protein